MRNQSTTASASADALLSRLDKVRQSGPDRWVACCPAHHDRTPSLAIRACPDGRILIHCFAGCSVEEIVGAVGLKLEDLFPPRPLGDRVSRERRPFLPSDVFEVARHEIAVAAIIAADMHKQQAVSEQDYARLFAAVERLNEISGASYGR